MLKEKPFVIVGNSSIVYGVNVIFGNNGSRPKIGSGTIIGNNVRIGDKVEIGKNCTIEDNVQLGYSHMTSKREDEIPENTLIGDNVVVRCNSVIYKGCNIGNNSIINHGVYLREGTIIGKHTKIGSGTCAEGNLTIGSYCAIHSQCHLTAHMEIGDYVFIAPFFLPTNDPWIVYKRSSLKERLIKERKQKERGPIIKFGARIGGGVIVIPEITIGREAFIAAGAVVTRDIPDFGIVRSKAVRAELMSMQVKEEDRLKPFIDYNPDEVLID